MEFFDCNACFGRHSDPPLRQARTPKALVEELDFHGIGQALVRHASMQDECPTLGNAKLIAELAQLGATDRLLPIWAILPPQTGELGTVEEFLADMARHNVRALWAFPAQHAYILDGLTFGPLFEELIARNVPLFVPDDWAMVHTLVKDFPSLTTVACLQGCWGKDRFSWPLLQNCPNFHMATSRYEVGGGIRAVCNRFGPQRLLFGTGFPRMAMGGPRLALQQANISDTDREAIASGNLVRLLEGVRL